MSAPVIHKKPSPRSMRRLAQILREFNTMDVTIEKVSPQSGDVLLFKVGDKAKLQGPMIEAFLQHLHERGIKDCMAMVLAPEDSIETVLAAHIGELAAAAGYSKGSSEDARQNRQKGRHDVVRLLEGIGAPAELVERIKEAIVAAQSNGKEAKPPEPEAPVERPYA